MSSRLVLCMCLKSCALYFQLALEVKCTVTPSVEIEIRGRGFFQTPMGRGRKWSRNSLSFASKQYKFEWKFGESTVNPQFEANSCSSELPFNVNKYSCTNLVSLPQVPPQRYTMCSSLSFQRCLITRGVTVITLAQSFANVADIEDHAFNLVLSLNPGPSRICGPQPKYWSRAQILGF